MLANTMAELSLLNSNLDNLRIVNSSENERERERIKVSFQSFQNKVDQKNICENAQGNKSAKIYMYAYLEFTTIT